MHALYDTIGHGYSNLRRPDARIAAALQHALGKSGSIVNVGAGTGSYESVRTTAAVELSATMIRQRPPDAAPVVQASATALPFRANSFDAALAILTVHHWPDKLSGLQEMQRVARDRCVIMTWDPVFPGFWLSDYFPQIMDIDRPIFPTLAEFEQALGPITVYKLPIPHDCSDGFMCAYWRRPHAYLNSEVRSAISTFAKMGDLSRPLQALEADLSSGVWQQRNAGLLEREELDLGYRIIVSNGNK